MGVVGWNLVMKVFRDLDDEVVIIIRYDGDYYKVILCVIWFLGFNV